MCKMKRQNIENEYFMRRNDCNCFLSISASNFLFVFKVSGCHFFPSPLVYIFVTDQQIELNKSTLIGP